MFIAGMTLGLFIGAMLGALIVAVVAAGDREVPHDNGPGYIHLYDYGSTTPGRYRVFTLYPGQVFSALGELAGSPPNEAFSGRE